MFSTEHETETRPAMIPWMDEDEEVRDHAVQTRDFLTVYVTCPSAPDDPQQPQWGRCQVCGVSLSGRTYPKEEE